MRGWLCVLLPRSFAAGQESTAAAGLDFSRAARERGAFYRNGIGHQYLQGTNYTVVAAAVPMLNGKYFGVKLYVFNRGRSPFAMIRKIPRGQVSTLAQIRRRLARWHNADVTCPLVTGIFLRIAAEAAEEDQQAGRPEITPYWRVVRDDGRLNAKFPGGVEAQAQRLREEGHEVENGKLVITKPAASAA